MIDATYAQYVPPSKVREHKFSVRLSAEDHIRILWWARNRGTDANRRRAEAARYAIQAFLEAEGVPSAEAIAKASESRGPRRRSIDRFLDEAGIPDSEELRSQHPKTPI